VKSLTGGGALCASLEQLGVRHVFGVPGTQNVGLFEALRQSKLRTVLATHELAAGFMANGYYRASGKVGVLATIPGPGFAFTLAAIAEAAQDSAGLLFITSKAAQISGRKFNLQDIDQRAILAPLVKRTIDVDDPEKIVSAVREAYALATAGEPGPVVLNVNDHTIESQVHSTTPVGTAAAFPSVAKEVAQIAELMKRATRTVFFVGQGTNNNPARLKELAELLRAPVIATRSARGVLPEDHPLALTFDFTDAGLTALNSVLDRSDLIVALGCKFSHNGTYGFRLKFAKEKLVHVDSAEHVLGANYATRLSVCADVPTLLDAIWTTRDAISPKPTGWSDEELSEIRRLAQSSPTEPAIRGVDPPSPSGFFKALREAMPRDSCLVTDSGWHQVLANRHYRVHDSRGLIIPSDFQSMGFGLPAAIGAKLAAPHRKVGVLIGDGGLAMSGLEMITAVREEIPLTVFVFNDGALGQIRFQQLSSFGRSHATELTTPDISLLAAAVGAQYAKLDSNPVETLRAAIQFDGVSVVEVDVSDSMAVRTQRMKGLARQTARRTISAKALTWVKKKIRP
jgi:acetolactate synthase-1/2/3 large subunit